MAKIRGTIDYSELEKLKDKLANFDNKALLIDCTLELAQMYLDQVTELTPVVTGNLKGDWHNTTPKITKQSCSVDIVNGSEYASYVEYGHRQKVGKYIPALGKRLVKPWVKGRFMMDKTNRIIEEGMPKYLQHKLDKAMDELNDK